jgi:hypothetical protein
VRYDFIRVLSFSHITAKVTPEKNYALWTEQSAIKRSTSEKKATRLAANSVGQLRESSWHWLLHEVAMRSRT